MKKTRFTAEQVVTILREADERSVSRAQTMKILGRPTTSAGDTLLYSHEREEPIRGQIATATNRLTICFRNTVLDAVEPGAAMPSAACPTSTRRH
jgi:hypothetical protein